MSSLCETCHHCLDCGVRMLDERHDHKCPHGRRCAELWVAQQDRANANPIARDDGTELLCAQCERGRVDVEDHTCVPLPCAECGRPCMAGEHAGRCLDCVEGRNPWMHAEVV